jgi:hypothetical protein
VLRLEGCDHRRHVAAAEPERCDDAQMAPNRAAALGKCVVDLAEAFQDLASAFCEQLALVGQRQVPPRAIDQMDAKPGLQGTKPLGYSRRRDVQVARGRRQGRCPGDGRKEAKVIGRQHSGRT